MSAALPIAAIVHPPKRDAGPFLREAAFALAARGVVLGGVLPVLPDAAAAESCALELEDVISGERFHLTQNLGSGSTACRLDPGALAGAAAAARRALDGGAQLLLFNKFGALEAAGQGLRQEMGQAVVRGTPVLTTVAERFVPDWQAFTGGRATLLRLDDLDAVQAWWQTLRTTAAAG
ncbi:DUF2478 domain-containing protein [Pseudothauera nasutitermitis]|uniref:DUF2478 domain-containing protein n=1 Tax=Pseudothauera nasutitermitis TaxID=2565930 RepID=A0A4S4AQD1_9RHOO|nr:DUF2478 domain-containing protein [Pseudothauera nasutitermitis]THF61945.1 DUF2478 domain-containing protein [Pseudothauera nasutitermitis]